MTRTLGLGVPLVLALLAGGAALAQAAPPIRRTTPAGQAVKIRDHVQLTQSCASSAPTISFSQNPAHGTVEVKPDRFVFGKGNVTGATRACEGQEVDGVAIWYTPAAGFHGVDRMAWTTDFGGKGSHRRVDNHRARVTVQ